MHFAKVAWSSFNANVNNMANILGGNAMIFFSIRPKYLVEKTGTFVEVRRFLVLR